MLMKNVMFIIGAILAAALYIAGISSIFNSSIPYYESSLTLIMAFLITIILKMDNMKSIK